MSGAVDTALLKSLEAQVTALLGRFDEKVTPEGESERSLFTLDEKLKIIDRGLKISALNLKLEDSDEGGGMFRRPPPWAQRPSKPGEDPRDQ